MAKYEQLSPLRRHLLNKKALQSCHLLTDFIQILQMFIIWDDDKLSEISGKLEMCLVESPSRVEILRPHPHRTRKI